MTHAPVPARSATRSHVIGADAVAVRAGPDVCPSREPIIRQLGLPLDLDNPFVAVRYAHADAASTLRWAATSPCRLPATPRARGGTPGARSRSELALLDAMSWLPERVAAAARRRRPAEVAAYLEYVAGAWLDCREVCPALPFQGSGAPRAGRRRRGGGQALSRRRGQGHAVLRSGAARGRRSRAGVSSGSGALSARPGLVRNSWLM